MWSARFKLVQFLVNLEDVGMEFFLFLVIGPVLLLLFLDLVQRLWGLL